MDSCKFGVMKCFEEMLKPSEASFLRIFLPCRRCMPPLRCISKVVSEEEALLWETMGLFG